MDGTYLLNSLTASSEGLVLPVGLRIGNLQLDLGGASFDLATNRLTLAEEGSATAVVREQDVAAFIERQSDGVLRQVEAEIGGGLVKIHATAKLIFEVRATVTCRLVIEDDRRLVVELEDVSVPLARGAVEGQLAKINPLIDAADLPLTLLLREVTAESGAITLRAEAPVQ
ncbi:MAG: LmeA family phospholipid-binding protein [Fimbriimonadaceae bacterium]|nr:LmeA family phospholipid-binding protein [Fimbriimonadaceae bacterium]QYK55068.1 MAG: LmeA family phospholipid-binding protein [Fimbriimonadaceae bacterium]